MHAASSTSSFSASTPPPGIRTCFTQYPVARFYFTLQVDSILTFSGAYDYQLGGGVRYAFVDVSAHDLTSGVTLLNEYQFAGPFDPSVGTLNVSENAQVSLLAGRPYVFTYGMEVGSLNGSSTVLSHGNGTIQIRIAPIPEPATLAMLLPALLRVRRRSRGGR